jgi:hypothetical protein
MIKMFNSRMFWGALLILGGVLFLLQNLFGFQYGDLFWALVLGLVGLFFLTIFFSNRANWWALIPGFTLLGVALSVSLNLIAPSLSSTLSGPIVLGSIGASFLVIYLLNREYWWAIIPCGVLLTLAIVISLENLLTEMGFVSIFFLGLAATFALVALVPTAEGKMQWAWIPAIVLALMGVIFGAFSGAFMAYLLPIALIVGGGILIFRTLAKK